MEQGTTTMNGRRMRRAELWASPSDSELLRAATPSELGKRSAGLLNLLNFGKLEKWAHSRATTSNTGETRARQWAAREQQHENGETAVVNGRWMVVSGRGCSWVVDEWSGREWSWMPVNAREGSGRWMVDLAVLSVYGDLFVDLGLRQSLWRSVSVYRDL